MIKGTTESGFEYEIEAEALDDYELLESLTAIDRGEAQEIFSVVDRLLGKEQKERLMKFLRKNGRVSAKAVIAAITEILNSCREGKNS